MVQTVSRSPVIWIISLLVAAVGTLQVINAFRSEPAIHLTLAFFFLSTAVGLVFNRVWSQYLIYLMWILIIGYWTYSLWWAFEHGWRLEWKLRNLLSLWPGMVLVALAVLSSMYVYQYFRKLRDA